MKTTVLLRKSQISKSELARLTNFSRPTIQRWLEDGTGPRRNTDRVVYRGILDALEHCLLEKRLPLPPDLSSAERDRRIKAMVREQFDLEDIQRLIA